MAEVLFNWTLLIATFGGLFLVAWIGYRDLQGLGERSQGRSAAQARNPIVGRRPAWEHAPALSEDAVRPEAEHLLRIQYISDGVVEKTEFISDERPGYVGTEGMPGMGSGTLVRHAEIRFDGDRFTVENRHGSQSLAWQAGSEPGESADHGEIPPREKLALDGGINLVLGDWVVELRDIGGVGSLLRIPTGS